MRLADVDEDFFGCESWYWVAFVSTGHGAKWVNTNQGSIREMLDCRIAHPVSYPWEEYYFAFRSLYELRRQLLALVKNPECDLGIEDAAMILRECGELYV